MRPTLIEQLHEWYEREHKPALAEVQRVETSTFPTVAEARANINWARAAVGRHPTPEVRR